MGIKKLIDSVPKGPGVPFIGRLTTTLRKKILADFRELASAEAKGMSIPNFCAIVRFIKEEYNVEMDRGTAVLWMKHAREEKEDHGKKNK